MGWKNACMSWKSGATIFLTTESESTLETVLETASSCVDIHKDSRFVGSGNKSHDSDRHISLTKISDFKTPNLRGAGRSGAETRCTAYHIMGNWHHGGKLCRHEVELLDTLFWCSQKNNTRFRFSVIQRPFLPIFRSIPHRIDEIQPQTEFILWQSELVNLDLASVVGDAGTILVVRQSLRFVAVSH